MRLPTWLKKRLRNKAFVVACGGFVALAAKTVFKVELPAGINELAELGLSILVMTGIVIDPTTEGLKDGE